MLTITIKKKNHLMHILAVAVYFFSTICFVNEDSLNMLMLSGICLFVMSMLIVFRKRVNLMHIIGNKICLWLTALYIMYEIYGFFYLRMGSFNWDLYLFHYIESIAIVIILEDLGEVEEIFDVLVSASKIGLVAAIAYMYVDGSIKFTSISFGDRLGDDLTGNVNSTAVRIGTLFFVLFVSLCRTRKKSWLSIIVCIVSVVIMLFTGSKKGLIILMAAFFSWMIIKKKPIKILAIPVVVIVSIYAIFNVPALYNTIGNRIVDMFAAFGIGEAVTAYQSTQNRMNFVSIGLKSFTNVFLLGGGINYFQYINNVYAYSHNNYIEMLNSFGIMGSLIFYLPPVKALFKGIALTKKTFGKEKELIKFSCVLIAMKLTLDIGMISFSGPSLDYFPFIVGMLIINRCGVNHRTNELRIEG